MDLIIRYWLDTHVGPGFLLVSEDTEITEVAFQEELLVWRRWTNRNYPPAEDKYVAWRHTQDFLGVEEQGWSAFPREGGFWEEPCGSCMAHRQGASTGQGAEA